MVTSLTLVAFCLAAPQAGDKPGESQEPLSAELVVPAAPALSPAEQLETFEVEEPPRVAKPLKPRGSPQNWVTNDDYPSSALRAGQSGTVGFRLNVDAGGRVTDCTVTSSSGVSVLDSTACSLLRRRARFVPAEDASGNKIPATFSSRFTWQIPDR